MFICHCEERSLRRGNLLTMAEIASDGRASPSQRHGLWLNRIPCINPRLKPAKNRSDVCKAIVQKEERRTGARVFVLSGAVGDDPLIFIESYDGRVGFDLIHWNIERAWDVTQRESICASHVQEDRRAAIVRDQRLFQYDAWNIIFCLWKMIGGRRASLLDFNNGGGNWLRVWRYCVARERCKDENGDG